MKWTTHQCLCIIILVSLVLETVYSQGFTRRPGLVPARPRQAPRRRPTRRMGTRGRRRRRGGRRVRRIYVNRRGTTFGPDEPVTQGDDGQDTEAPATSEEPAEEATEEATEAPAKS